jgi:glycosyltransferase involved in cell wall biosynthesis
VPAVEKQPKVVFLGRLVPGKGVDDLLRVLPDLWRRLEGTPGGACQFSIAGYGSLEKQVSGRVRELQEKGIPVEFVGYQEAAPLLAASAVVLSLQEVTNFPSRVVPEALLAGCAVVVRDTGDSREFGIGLPGLEYCSATLDAEELAGLLARYLPRITQDAKYRNIVRVAALKRFSSNEYIDYFSRIIFDTATQAMPPPRTIVSSRNSGMN